MKLMQAASKAVTGDPDAAEKEIEKGIVRICAIAKRGRLSSIKSNYDEKFEEAAKETKSSLKSISNQLDKAIHGDFSKSIKGTIENKVSGYDKL